MKMTKIEFKRRWENDEKIVMDDIADCAIEWGLYNRPRINSMDEVRYRVLKEANIKEAEDYLEE